MKTFLRLTLVALAAAACSEKTPAPQPAAQKTPTPPAARDVTTPMNPPANPATKGLVKVEPSPDYPLKTCVVSGEKLGEMGPIAAYTYDGKEVQFCCPDCVKDFETDPAKYLAKIPAKK